MRFPRLAARIIAALTLLTTASHGYEVEQQMHYPSTQDGTVLRIISTADLNVFEPILLAFQDMHPSVAVDYVVVETADLMHAIYAEGASFDLAISSAMDLQTKLANDGFAQDYTSPATQALPDWARWRNQVFAFTQEPAVLVVSDDFFGTEHPPTNRDELIALLRESPERFRGRIGTYDVRRSGFGYLMATQDSRNSEAYWRLMEVMGRLEAELYCCSGEMIRDVASGNLALAYNVLGSYATSQLAITDGFRIIELSDYVNVMLRTALIPVTAENVADAQAMIDFLTMLETRPDLIAASNLPSIAQETFRANTALRPIRFGPGLLVFLDQLKRAAFLRNWEDSLLQN
ncbi:iron(III) transport system substrate-binding protein [Monaibacterium marinum]|uniref:Iron(III) transport system substrate-binding protein n=1 Tax=Pontivivens marinum TaxID=1690039 RepID=A0A2C9CV66_9RHOB|nr:substrate-binding domain-containing protein [Monaibacterium marinum]SOH95148.1 iron(III) transport system substrate-binding protein [Monaibacterium marinum]